MWIYSVAIGISIAGCLMLFGIGGSLLVRRAFAGWSGVFGSDYGIEWHVVITLIFSVLCASAGVIALIVLGYQPADPIVVIITSVITFALLYVVYAAISSIVERRDIKHRLNPARRG